MIWQFFFLFVLQAAGILFGFAFRNRLPLAFLVIGGLLWGSLFWVLCSLLLLVFRLPYTVFSMGLFISGFLVTCFIWNIRNHNFYFQPAEVKLISAWLIFSTAFFWLVSRFNFTFVSPDSLVLILNGRAFISQGFSPFIISQLALRGFFSQALQASSVFLGLDYLYALQPALGMVSVAVFLYFNKQILSTLNQKTPSVWLSVIFLLVMFSAYYLPFQVFYIHTNFLSGIYLMTAVGCLWLSLRQSNYCWLFFGMLALTAFSLLRTEAPLFSLVFLAIYFSSSNIPGRVRVVAYLPFASILVGWYLYLLLKIGSGSYILNPLNILSIVAALLGFYFLILLARIHWVRSRVLPNLHLILLFCLTIIYLALIIWDGSRTAGFQKALVLNALIYGLWGNGWLVIATGLALAICFQSIPHERLFLAGITAFLLLLGAISTRNVMYQFDWGDSANRMLMHIYPTCFLYLSIKFNLSFWATREQTEGLHQHRMSLIGGLGIGLLLALFVISLTR